MHGCRSGGNKPQVAPSGRTPLQSLNGWLDQRRAWQFALIAAFTVGAAATAAAILAQWLLHGHLNLSAALGTAAGTMTGTFTVALGVRLTRPPKH
jgi:hypothetical protein